jgi:aspartate racemase
MGVPKTVGVLGGMGPAATVEFFRRLVASTPASIDQQHLHILIDNNPSVPDRTRALLYGGPTPAHALVQMAQRLESAGAQVLAMPCNTAHAFLRAIREGVSIPVVDMVAETAGRIEGEAVGLLATSGTIGARIYHRAFRERGIRLIVPTEESQRTVARAIDAIKAGRELDEVGDAIARVVAELHEQGADSVVAGCTEISLLEGGRMPIRWVDALDVLVEATIREAYREDADS